MTMPLPLDLAALARYLHEGKSMRWHVVYENGVAVRMEWS